VLLAGRQAGKKAVVIKTSDDGTKVRKFNERKENSVMLWWLDWKDALEK
jgi:ribosomal protein L14E/L6E/L27E